MTRDPIEDEVLDDLLARGSATGPPPAALPHMLHDARIEADIRRGRSRRRRLVLVPVVALGAAMLTASTTATAYWLGVPPFQGLPDGWSRTTEYIPVEWVSPDGEEERCRTYLEVLPGDRGLLDALDAAIAAHDWTGFGQELYDQLPGSPPATSVETDVLDLSRPIVREFVADAVPGLTRLGALATTCRTDL